MARGLELGRGLKVLGKWEGGKHLWRGEGVTD